MPTYAENAAARERAARKAAQDRHLGTLQRRFDATAGENRMKYERASFAVVTASDAFRAGYDQIDWKSSPRSAAASESKPAQPANEAK